MKGLEFCLSCVTLLVIFSTQGWCQNADSSSSTGVEPEVTADPDVRHLTVTSILTKPWLIVKDAETQGNDRFTGFVSDLLSELSEICKFSYTITLVLDGKYGRKVEETHKWNGMIGELVEDDADLAAAPLSITSAREHVVSFTDPWLNVSLAALVPSDSGITSLQELVDHPTIKYGAIKGGATMEAFRSTQETIFLDMWTHIGGDQATNVDSQEQGVKQVQEGNYSFIAEAPSAEYFANTECGVSLLGETFLPREGGYGFALQKNDDLLGDINAALTTLQEDGTIDELYSEWFKEVERCNAASVLSASLLLSFVAMIFTWI